MEQEITTPIKQFSLFELGFRPFFLLASLFSIIAIAFWMATYSFGWALPVNNRLTSIAWHGHEMIYGYSMAVIAGFLLTAVKNWTNIPTFRGIPLFSLCCIWLLARILPFITSISFGWVAVIDNLFFIGLIFGVSKPIINAKQWRQMMIVSKLILLLASNILFYLGIFGILDQGVQWGLFSGVYLILSLIFTLSRRVMPFFIERGVGYPLQLKNWQWIDNSSLVLLFLLWIVDVFIGHQLGLVILATSLTVVHAVRMWGWYTPGIWSKPLLWVLYSAYGMFVIGFALKATTALFNISPFIALHAFTYGGIGMMTIGMMARISLGHTGRSIMEPPTILKWIFSCLVIGTISRVFMPIFFAEFYNYWITISQTFWLIAFSLFLARYLPIFILPRTDGKPG